MVSLSLALLYQGPVSFCCALCLATPRLTRVEGKASKTNSDMPFVPLCGVVVAVSNPRKSVSVALHMLSAFLLLSSLLGPVAFRCVAQSSGNPCIYWAAYISFQYFPANTCIFRFICFFCTWNRARGSHFPFLLSECIHTMCCAVRLWQPVVFFFFYFILFSTMTMWLCFGFVAVVSIYFPNVIAWASMVWDPPPFNIQAQTVCLAVAFRLAPGHLLLLSGSLVTITA